MAESMKPFAWYSPKLSDCITDAKKESRKTIIPWEAEPFTDPLFTAAQLEQARREEREACAALVKAIRDNLGEISMRASIVYDACTVIDKAILTRNEK